MPRSAGGEPDLPEVVRKECEIASVELALIRSISANVRGFDDCRSVQGPAAWSRGLDTPAPWASTVVGPDQQSTSFSASTSWPTQLSYFAKLAENMRSSFAV